MTVTTSSQVNGDSSVREMASSYPTLWGRELVSADRVETLPSFLGDTGWLTLHRFRRTSRRAPNLLLPTAVAAFTGSAVATKKVRHVNSVPDERSACLNGDMHSWSTFSVDRTKAEIGPWQRNQMCGFAGCTRRPRTTMVFEFSSIAFGRAE